MLRAKLSFFLAVFTVAILLSACGGSNVVDPGLSGSLRATTAPTNLPAAPVSAHVTLSTSDDINPNRFSDAAPASLVAEFAAAEAPVTPGLFAPDLPALPVDDVSTTGHGVSAVTTIDLENMAESTPTVIYSGGALNIPSANDEIAWARYAVELPENEDLIGFSINGTYQPSSVVANRSGLWVGLSNYSEKSWMFFGPYTLESYVSVDNLDPARFGNNDGWMHVLLLTGYGDGVQLTNVQTYTEAAVTGVLPMEMGTALANVGLNISNLSLRESNELLNPDSEIGFNVWGWYLYSYDATPTYYEDLRTYLPSFWSGWSGNDEGTDFEAEEYPEYIDGKADAIQESEGLQDLLMAGIAEMPADKRSTAQSFNPTLSESDALAEAINDFVVSVGGEDNLLNYQTALGALADEDQVPLARVVAAVQGAYELRDAALDPILNTAASRQVWYNWAHGQYFVPLPGRIDAIIDVSGGVYYMRAMPYNTIYFEGACQIADAIDQLKAYIDTNNPAWANVGLEIETSVGRVVVGGTGNDTYVNHIFPIIGKDDSNRRYIIAGDYTDLFQPGTIFSVNWSTCDEDDLDAHTVASVEFTGGNTEITVVDELNDSIADGEIRLNGFAILIDLGGDDTYTCTAGATASGQNGVSVCLDLAGDDTYMSMDDPLDGLRGNANNDNTSQYGAGRFGVGILVDFDGSEEYTASRMSQGFAMHGVGALVDYGDGSDSYEMDSFGQGSAIGGIGLLYDDGGSANDYTIWRQGQGYGGVMGVGMLIQDGTGNDLFYAEPAAAVDRPEFASSLFPSFADTMAQGAASGIRWSETTVNPETGNRFVAAGGYGLLYDGGGDDQYYCGIYGQGVGFFHGHGVLIDAAGSDYYDGYAYSQGAAVACGLAMLWDVEGDDYHENKALGAFGGANNWATAWMVDRGGNDIYNASSLALGTGYSNGYGLFIEINGNDTYTPLYADATVENLGRAMLDSEQRTDQRCLGLFVDARGADTYSPGYAGMLLGTDASTVIDTPPANGAAWTRVGGGWDGGGGYYDLGYGTGLDGQ
ncbi:hypothetical protein JW859_07555 [bacterium]|nr:hypothetical protein [bacterium]